MGRSYFRAGGLAILALMAGCDKPVSKPQAPVTTAPAAPKKLANGLDVPPDNATVEIDTDQGNIVVAVDGKDAPITAANFLHYVDNHKLDGGTFYRSVKAGPAGFIQFNSGERTYPPIAHEPTTQTHLSHTDGAISTARYAVGTASNEFTICVGDMTYLDAGGSATADKQGFAVFGHVVSGMDVVKRILKARISTAKPAPGDWAGETLAKPVTIISAHRAVISTVTSASAG